MSLKDKFPLIDSIATYPKTGPRIQAVLKENFEVRMVKKMKKGQEVEESVPKIKAGAKFPVMKMDLFWMSPAEKGGVGLDIGMMEYLRLTYPDGTPTKYFDLFDYVEISSADFNEVTEEAGD